MVPECPIIQNQLHRDLLSLIESPLVCECAGMPGYFLKSKLEDALVS